MESIALSGSHTLCRFALRLLLGQSEENLWRALSIEVASARNPPTSLSSEADATARKKSCQYDLLPRYVFMLWREFERNMKSDACHYRGCEAAGQSVSPTCSEAERGE